MFAVLAAGGMARGKMVATGRGPFKVFLVAVPEVVLAPVAVSSQKYVCGVRERERRQRWWVTGLGTCGSLIYSRPRTSQVGKQSLGK
jgi:hypothetical protein